MSPQETASLCHWAFKYGSYDWNVWLPVHVAETHFPLLLRDWLKKQTKIPCNTVSKILKCILKISSISELYLRFIWQNIQQEHLPGVFVVLNKIKKTYLFEETLNIL